MCSKFIFNRNFVALRDPPPTTHTRAAPPLLSAGRSESLMTISFSASYQCSSSAQRALRGPSRLANRPHSLGGRRCRGDLKSGTCSAAASSSARIVEMSRNAKCVAALVCKRSKKVAVNRCGLRAAAGTSRASNADGMASSRTSAESFDAWYPPCLSSSSVAVSRATMRSSSQSRCTAAATLGAPTA
ncbi:hypothetical protein T492DRAFT_178116 [Pavlovales sp. CCMP2436]|nr:hypothetical protein T492DRAFT_178116 [Pavlovales sp. CCMP2436]